MQHPPPDFWAAAALAEFVRDQASWRRTQAARFPADPRNARSAAALDELADFITSLDVGDRHLGELITLEAFDDHDRLRPSDELRRVVARHGYDRTTASPRDVIQEIVATVRRERRPAAHERKSPVTLTTDKPRLSRPEVSTLADIFGLAADHDRRLVEARTQIARPDLDEPLGDRLNVYEVWLLDLIATIAPAAIARLDVLAPLDLGSKGSILELQGEQLERFLGPIFEEAGIRERLVVQPGAVERLTRTARRRYRFRFSLGAASAQDARRRALSPAEQVEMLRTHVQWEDIVLGRRRIGRWRYTHVTEDLVQGEAIIEPGEMLPPYFEVEDIRTAGTSGNTVRFDRKRIEVEPAVDSVEPLTETAGTTNVEDLAQRANDGDADALAYLNAHPELAFFDELTKMWVVQVDSGPRSPGISAQRDHIIRTRPPER